MGGDLIPAGLEDDPLAALAAGDDTGEEDPLAALEALADQQPDEG